MIEQILRAVREALCEKGRVKREVETLEGSPFMATSGPFPNP